jgi:hypothetical protein
MILGDRPSQFNVIPEKAINKHIKVKGKVQLFKGQPMIVIRNTAQITVL